ncbi:MAG: helix-turn-helix domain-containing protein [Intestinibacter sp.]
MDSRKIGKLIASKRKEKKLTQKELGLKINVSDKTISKWESGLGLPGYI